MTGPGARRARAGACGYAPLAQLDRASGYEPGGRRFESCRARQTFLTPASVPSRARPSRAVVRSSIRRTEDGQGTPSFACDCAEVSAATRSELSEPVGSGRPLSCATAAVVKRSRSGSHRRRPGFVSGVRHTSLPNRLGADRRISQAGDAIVRYDAAERSFFRAAKREPRDDRLDPAGRTNDRREFTTWVRTRVQHEGHGVGLTTPTASARRGVARLSRRHAKPSGADATASFNNEADQLSERLFAPSAQRSRPSSRTRRITSAIGMPTNRMTKGMHKTTPSRISASRPRAVNRPIVVVLFVRPRA